jgi:hypothetical protein
LIIQDVFYRSLEFIVGHFRLHSCPPLKFRR